MTVPQALFEVTNHSGLLVTCQVAVDVYKPGDDHPEFRISQPVFLKPHSTELVEAPIPDDTHGLRFIVVLSSAGGEEAFPQFTNLWRTP
jgi:hypothetical protein